MKKFIPLLLLCLSSHVSFAQDNKEKIEKACLDYIEGFYEGDTAKLVRGKDLYKNR